jgi:hypothetical protein
MDNNEKEKKFYGKFYQQLLNDRLDKKDEPLEVLMSDIITTDAIELMALENKTEHEKLSKITEDLTKRILELETKDLINKLLNQAIIDLNLDTVQAKTFKECTEREIPHQIRTHPEFPREQAIAVAFSKCRERFGRKRRE